MHKSRLVAYTQSQVFGFLEAKVPDIAWREVVGDKLPRVVLRSRWDDLAKSVGLPFCRGHITNLDLRGEGPASYPK